MKDTKNIINTIIHGDCIEVLKNIASESIDSIFADPPYFMQTEGELLRTNGTKFNGVEDSWDKFNSYNDYDQFTFEWLKECKRILKKDGSIWVIGSFQNIYRLGFIMQNLGFWILNDVIWSKPNAVPNFGGTRFQNSHETLLWCTKDKKSKYCFNYKTMKFLNNNKQEKSVWDIGICIGSERLKDNEGKKVHSTQKPKKLLYNIILSSTKPNDIILDPFFGTGTTGAVAKELGRNFIGIEKELNYIKHAKKRIKNVKPNINEITELCLETKPPKVSMETLIKNQYLKCNQKMYNSKGEFICTLLENGQVTDNEDILSIHKMSGKHLNKSNHNGWDYFYIKKDKSLISINDLRYQYHEKGKENGR